MKKHSFLFIIAISILTGCTKDNVKPETPAITPDDPTIESAYLLNEGNWGGNDASISLIDLTNHTVNNDFFAQQNGRNLGDVAQDMVLYGSKLYVTVYNSGILEILNAGTGKSVKQIPLSGGPRFIACHEGKVYVTCYDKTVVRIDTASLEIDGTCGLTGMQPEGIAVSNGKLFVCNSWEYDATGNIVYDSTVAVIDIASFTLTRNLTVAQNPQQMAVLQDGSIVVHYGNDYNNPSGLAKINPVTESVTPIADSVSGFAVRDNDIYIYHYNYPNTNVYAIRAGSTAKCLVFANNVIGYPYRLSINPSNGDIYLTDGVYGATGDIYCYTSSGSLQWKLETGYYPTKMITGNF